ncbi:MAG: YidC/Oxa1 family membrane protein insertase [Ardenticatenia bacterium]|nr:YidC/Oxa1 family membrane protein insertase [Ardenticatenia bacterium]
MGALWNAFVQLLIDALVFLHGLVGSYGLAIVVFTLVVRLVTVPLTLKQIRSSKAMQELQPKIKELQRKYKDDKERQTQEMMRLYREAGVNPASGCLPILIQMPIWIGLYRALFQMADQGILQEGWLWIPSLAEPRGLEWLTNTANWGVETVGYLILPVLTVVTQMVVQRMIAPTMSNSGQDDPSAAIMSQMNTIMPIMFGFFALQVPSGLALYWVTSNVFQIVQQYVLMREHEKPLPQAAAAASSPAAGSPPATGGNQGGRRGSESERRKTHGKSRRRKRKKR